MINILAIAYAYSERDLSIHVNKRFEFDFGEHFEKLLTKAISIGYFETQLSIVIL